jgi:hypothetical protein
MALGTLALLAPGGALILGLPALVGSWIGGSWVKAGVVPEPVQLAMFAAAALVASWLLTRHRSSAAAGQSPAAPAQGCAMARVLAGQGLLIAVNALVAFAALGHWPTASLPLLLPLVLGGAIGALVGQRLAPHLSDR